MKIAYHDFVPPPGKVKPTSKCKRCRISKRDHWMLENPLTRGDLR